MSTNTRPTTESQTTTLQSTPADASTAETPPKMTDDAQSWVARCQQQFDSARTDRLRNLADGENEAMLE